MGDETLDMLRDRVAKLEALVAQQQRSAVLLVRRDLELSRVLEKLKTLDADKSKFISVAAHQLRTPLSAIRWALEHMLTEKFGETTVSQRTLIMKTLETSVRLIRIVNELLDVDRIEADRTRIMRETVNAHDILMSVIAELSPSAVHNKIHLELCSKVVGATLITTDSQKLRSIMQNLIENGIKYTRAGGVVEVCLYREGNKIIFTVADTGIGIPHNQQKNVFTKFFRAENAVKVQTDGSGLGLYLVAELVKRLSGTISFTSTEGKGTTFTAVFPVDAQ